MDLAKTTARRDEKGLCLGIGRILYKRIDGNKAGCRLLHSPSLVAVWLSVGCETWPPTGWHRPSLIGCLNIGWDCFKRNGLWAHVISGTIFRGCWQSLCTAQQQANPANLPAVMLCKETVKESRQVTYWCIRPEQNGWHFEGQNCIFWNEKVWNPIKFFQRFVLNP